MDENVLTKETLFAKTQVKSLEEVKKVDLWGEGLTDVSIVAHLPNIEVMSLPMNAVITLKPFEKCSSLQELYLRKNKISSLREVTHLKRLPALHILWLEGNPCSALPHYREFVLHCCPQLKRLDNADVTAEERTKAAKTLTTKVLEEILPPPSSPSPSRLSQSRPSTASAAPVLQTGAKGKASPPPTGTSAAPSSPRGSAGASANSPNSQGAAEERMANGRKVLYTTTDTQRAMLLSILSLLPELTVESLQLLEKEVQERVKKQKEVVAKYSQDA